MRAPLILLGGIIVLSLAVARALSCVCSPLECDILTVEDCPGGLTWDPCKCCKVCARVEGEPCGGLFGFSGSCAVGLQCVIKNLRPPDELDEGICTKIPGRWRRHCPHQPKMSGGGCNLIGDGIASSETGQSDNTGRCLCGPSVPWCPGEPRPYTFTTRHECQLNLDAKIAYGVHGTICPEDSIPTEDGCKCVTPCLPHKCQQGQHPVQVKPARLENPGNCCPIYNCVPSEPISFRRSGDDRKDPQICIDNNGITKSVGDEWQPQPCNHCTCEETNDDHGRISCQATMCKSCEKPTPIIPGECCPRCLETIENNNTNTIKTITSTSKNIHVPVVTSSCNSLDDCDPPCHLDPVTDADGCPICTCPNVIQNTTNIDLTDEICPELSHCGHECIIQKDQSGCPVCACDTNIDTENTVKPVNVPYEEEDAIGGGGGVDDDGIICPAFKCDLHCDMGLLMDENDCTICQCKPQASCPSPIRCKKKCPYGYKLNRRGCPSCRCRATCLDHHNNTHPEGSSWHPDVCTSCTCDSASRLVCKEIVCSIACKNPLPPVAGTCCPICPINEIVSKNEHTSTRGWGIIPITLIAVLTLFCMVLMIYVVRNKYKGKLSPSTNMYTPYPAQYYKCVPAYDTPSHHNEKIVPL
ncbi:hypothetical protein HCN44_006403 [Aphidius gifuensis]|uniref:Cysteine-rich motor neuron 1 protein n=1 Tax=Aphidius gifuensis TaxID=684658 RepID=A0A834XTT1_APHGI|nr:hypothetical protein HCN44_006403 [Aphidius gifuensis]